MAEQVDEDLRGSRRSKDRSDASFVSHESLKTAPSFTEESTLGLTEDEADPSVTPTSTKEGDKFLQELETVQAMNENYGHRLKDLRDYIENLAKASSATNTRLQAMFTDIEKNRAEQERAKIDLLQIRKCIDDLAMRMNAFCKDMHYRLEGEDAAGVVSPASGSLLDSVRLVGSFIKTLKQIDAETEDTVRDTDQPLAAEDLQQRAESVRQVLEAKVQKLKTLRSIQAELEKTLDDVNRKIFETLRHKGENEAYDNVEISSDKNARQKTAVESDRGAKNVKDTAVMPSDSQFAVDQGANSDADRQALVEVTVKLEEARQKRDKLEEKRQRHTEQLLAERVKQAECFRILRKEQESLDDARTKLTDVGHVRVEQQPVETLLSATRQVLDLIWANIYSTEKELVDLKWKSEEDREVLHCKQRECTDLSERYEAVCDEVRSVEQEYYQHFEDANQQLRMGRAEILQLLRAAVASHREFCDRFEQICVAAAADANANEAEAAATNKGEGAVDQEERIEKLKAAVQKLEVLNGMMKEHMAHELCHAQQLKQRISNLLANQTVELHCINAELRRESAKGDEAVKEIERWAQSRADIAARLETRNLEMDKRMAELDEKIAKTEQLRIELRDKQCAAISELSAEERKLELLFQTLGSLCQSYALTTRYNEQMKTQLAVMKMTVGKEGPQMTDNSGSPRPCDRGGAEAEQSTEEVWKYKRDTHKLEQLLARQLDFENLYSVPSASDATTIQKNRVSAARLEKTDELLKLKADWTKFRQIHEENLKSAKAITESQADSFIYKTESLPPTLMTSVSSQTASAEQSSVIANEKTVDKQTNGCKVSSTTDGVAYVVTSLVQGTTNGASADYGQASSAHSPITRVSDLDYSHFGYLRTDEPDSSQGNALTEKQTHSSTTTSALVSEHGPATEASAVRIYDEELRNYYSQSQNRRSNGRTASTEAAGSSTTQSNSDFSDTSSSEHVESYSSDKTESDGDALVDSSTATESSSRVITDQGNSLDSESEQLYSIQSPSSSSNESAVSWTSYETNSDEVFSI